MSDPADRTIGGLPYMVEEEFPEEPLDLNELARMAPTVLFGNRSISANMAYVSEPTHSLYGAQILQLFKLKEPLAEGLAYKGQGVDFALINLMFKDIRSLKVLQAWLTQIEQNFTKELES